MVSPDGIGELLRSIRERADRSREQQARRMTAAGLVCTVENLKRWETEKRLPTPVWRSAIRTVYDLTDKQLDQALENTRRHRRQQRMEDDDVKRRKLFTLAAATAGFAVLPGIAQAREGIDNGLDGDGAGDLAYLEGAFERHRGGYNGRAPDAVLGEMREDLALLAAVLRRPHPARDHTDLARTAAGISGLLAIVQHDRGDQANAHRWCATAAKAARESGDGRMTTWVLGRHAMVGLNYGLRGRPPASLRRLVGRPVPARPARPRSRPPSAPVPWPPWATCPAPAGRWTRSAPWPSSWTAPSRRIPGSGTRPRSITCTSPRRTRCSATPAPRTRHRTTPWP
ncbi:hypothetical protein ACGFYF_42615 [Streptomyces lavendulae]|uniref:hypothetical protein n=1 Tax=Streptomyces lavendulae TaxID=1914 RepID=UPI00371B1247